MKRSKYNNIDELPMILNAIEAADFLGMGHSQMYELVKHSDFPAFRVGKRIYIHRDKFLSWIDAQVDEKRK